MISKVPALPRLLWVAVTVVAGGWSSAMLAQESDRAGNGAEVEPNSAGWTREEAMAQLRMYPQDAYLQYVAMQLAHREGTAAAAGEEIGRITGATEPAWRRRTERVNLFSLFSGSLAVQESLQLETMTGEALDPRQQRNAVAPRYAPDELVAVSELQGPTTQSHPWTEMLAGRQPEFSTLASCVPEDQYYVRFQSAARLLEVLELNERWGAHLFSQTSRQAYTSLADERVLAQLALETSDLLRPFYDLVVEELAITGSDLYLREGTDITIIFRFQRPQVFRTQMDTFLATAEKESPQATRTEHEYRGIQYVSVATPDRLLHVFSAYPREDLHLRSNSEVGLKRVIDALLDAGSESDHSLAQSEEFAYIRTLMPAGAPEEDGFIYLSDPFIRRIVGPELKLTERRRVFCYNYLRMIGHACAMFETENGRPPESLDELAAARCAPGHFNAEHLACPAGGQYELSEDHRAGVCTHHGRIEALVPCCEIAETTVTGHEADMYVDFVTQYNQYWRTFFDPIAVRITATPEQYRLETIILPLINNSIYQAMASILGGEPLPLDLPPIPDRNIFTLALKFDKQSLLQQAGWEPPAPQSDQPQNSAAALRASAAKLRSIGIAMHNYHDTFGRFPPVASVDDSGKPLLSWRVHLLPFLGEQQLYEEFRLDEPWDSPHNKTLISRLPPVYDSPGRDHRDAGTTTYVGIVGDNLLFDGTKNGTKMASITDGTSLTVMLVDAEEARAVIWTKPEDVAFDPQTLRNIILDRFGPDGLVVMADGAVRVIRPTVTDTALERALIRNDGAELGEFGEPAAVSRPRRGLLGLTSDLGLSDLDQRLAYEFIDRGLGERIGLHVYDGEPAFDFQLTRFLGQTLGSFAGDRRFDDDFIPIFLLVASLNSPVYVSLPLEDNEITDTFLAHLDTLLAPMARRGMEAGFFRIERDFYTLPIAEGRTARSAAISFGPIKWRFFWARIGDSLYLATKPEVLQDLAAVPTPDATTADASDTGPAAHAMVRIRPEHWNEMLPNFQLGWAESQRVACLDNVGRMSSIARLVEAGGGDLDARGRQLYGVSFFCPSGGHYHADDASHATCSVHGSAAAPRQRGIGVDGGTVEVLLDQFKDLTLTLTFLEDGLHAVLGVDRR